MRTYIAPIRKCTCGVEWVAQVGGSGRRNSDHCDECYPFYRRATKLWYAAKTRSEKVGCLFTITPEWIAERLKNPCPKTGETFVVGGTNYSDRNPYSASLDKIDPTGGYTQENCQVVSWLYNCAKQRFSEEDVYNFCLKVVNLRSTDLATNAGPATP